MTNPIHLLKTKYSQLKSDKHFGEIFSGSVLVFGAKIIATIIGLGTSVIVARYYGAEVVGVLALINSYFAVITVFTLMGTNTSMLRLIPEYTLKYSKTAGWLIYKKTRLLVILFSIIAGILLFISSNWIAGIVFDRPDLAFLFMLASVILLFKTLQIFSLGGIRAVQKIKAFALIQLITPSVYLILLIIFTFTYYHKYMPVYIQFFNSVLLAIVSLWVINDTFKKQIHPNDERKNTTYKEIMKISFPMFLTSSMMVVMGELATIMTGVFLDVKEVGLYAIAYKITTLIMFVLVAINTVIAPKFSELFHQGKLDELFIVAKKSTKLIFWSIVPILLVFVLFGKWIIIKLYGVEFETSYYLILILSVGLFINSISGSVGNFMNMCGYENQLRNIMILSLLISVVLFVTLIPFFGIFGTAIVTTIVQIVFNLSVTYYIYKKFGKTFIYIPFNQIFVTKKK